MVSSRILQPCYENIMSGDVSGFFPVTQFPFSFLIRLAESLLEFLKSTLFKLHLKNYKSYTNLSFMSYQCDLLLSLSLELNLFKAEGFSSVCGSSYIFFIIFKD